MLSRSFIVINSSFAQKNLEKLVVLPFGHIIMSVKFEIQLLSITRVTLYACYHMVRFVIFVLVKICINAYDICAQA